MSSLTQYFVLEYAVVELDPTNEPSLETVRRAARKLMHKHHPDRGGDSSTFQAIQEAERVLTDYFENGTPADDPNVAPPGAKSNIEEGDAFGEQCRMCKRPFTFFLPARICRRCGHSVCDTCSPDKRPCPELGHQDPVRHCKDCLKTAERPLVPTLFLTDLEAPKGHEYLRQLQVECFPSLISFFRSFLYILPSLISFLP